MKFRVLVVELSCKHNFWYIIEIRLDLNTITIKRLLGFLRLCRGTEGSSYRGRLCEFVG